MFFSYVCQFITVVIELRIEFVCVLKGLSLYRVFACVYFFFFGEYEAHQHKQLTENECKKKTVYTNGIDLCYQWDKNKKKNQNEGD